MTNAYRWVQWNRHKRRYDLVVALAILASVGLFVGVGVVRHPSPNEVWAPILLLQALAVTGLLLLHVILAIGPLARLDRRFAPLLYNRRHLGVAFFFVVLLHAVIAFAIYGGFGVRDPLAALLAGYEAWGSVEGFPFEVLGFLALVIFAVMAATSHDFWLANLGPRTWKTLHMLVYVAYVLVLGHVALGAVQSEGSVVYPVLLGLGAATLAGLHVVAGVRDAARDRAAAPVAGDGWLDAGPVSALGVGDVRPVRPARGEPIALCRHEDGFSAVSGVCRHQGGPLHEGRVVDGCLTCPWHGYQYRPADGQSPPPYTERIETYDVRIVGEGGEARVHVCTRPHPPGTPVAPARPPNEGDSA